MHKKKWRVFRKFPPGKPKGQIPGKYARIFEVKTASKHDKQRD